MNLNSGKSHFFNALWNLILPYKGIENIIQEMYLSSRRETVPWLVYYRGAGVRGVDLLYSCILPKYSVACWVNISSSKYMIISKKKKKVKSMYIRPAKQQAKWEQTFNWVPCDNLYNVTQ